MNVQLCRLLRSNFRFGRMLGSRTGDGYGVICRAFLDGVD